MVPPKGYKELTEKDKRAILGALLVEQQNGGIPHGGLAKIARKLGCAPKASAGCGRTQKPLARPEQ